MADETPQLARRAELAAFLRAQRARLRPADVGLPEDRDRDPGLRGTPGLRREEVAQISGVSVTWYAENRARMARWEPAARAVLGQFRAAVGQRPDDPRFAARVAELTEVSPEFREWWAEYPIRDFRPATIEIDHPEIGRLDLEMFQLRPVEHPDMLMVLQVPRSVDDLQRVTSLLEKDPRPVRLATASLGS